MGVLWVEKVLHKCFSATISRRLGLNGRTIICEVQKFIKSKTLLISPKLGRRVGNWIFRAIADITATGLSFSTITLLI